MSINHGLNDAQNKASQIIEGPALIVAGAGTGKTRTLIHRLARLIESGISPHSILLLTFTRRASTELISRACTLLGRPNFQTPGGTFHSFAHFVLRQHGTNIGLDRRFTVIDQSDTLEIIGNFRSELGSEITGSKFPRKETIAAIFNKHINRQITLKQIIEKEYSHFDQHIDILKQIFVTFCKYKEDRQFLDFDDLLIKLNKLFDQVPEVKNRICLQYSHIMVDEYQDTNFLQAKITHHLGGENNNIMVVGDDAQSIYAFRGANFKNLFDFQGRFRPNIKVIKLEQNYRSTQPILNLSNAILEKMSQSFRKNLFTTITGGKKPSIVTVDDDYEQAEFIVSEIRNLVQQGVKLSEIAILFRAGFHAYQLELLLRNSQFPYVKYGGLRFTETAHIKDVLSHLNVVNNPEDDLAMTRILMLSKGIGRTGARRLIRKASEIGLIEALQNHKARGETKNSMDRLAKLLNNLAGNSLSPAEYLEKTIDFYQPILESKFDDWPKRLKDLKQLSTISKKYKDLTTMLSDMALDPPNKTKNDQIVIKDSQDDLVLSTVHSAKGLEWHSVFILQVVEGGFTKARQQAKKQELTKAEKDEELRLLYVAVTRAKENLYLMCPQSSSSNYYDTPISPLLQTLPLNLFHHHQS